jgi:hypothetical protein
MGKFSEVGENKVIGGKKGSPQPEVESNFSLRLTATNGTRKNAAGART